MTVNPKWIAALRSGNYTQGQSALRKDWTFADGGYSSEDDIVMGEFMCCLGVALDSTCQDLGAWDRNVWQYNDGDACTWDDVAIGHRAALERLGIDEEIVSDCIARNDTKGWTFAQIADWLETL